MKPSLPAARGPLSEQLLARLRTDHGSLPRPDARGARFDPLDDDDLQLALYVCYELHYRSFAEVDELREWDPDVIAFRGALESIFETALLDLASGPPAADVASAIRELGEGGPSRFARFLEKKASLEQFREFLIHRSAYQLKEADPHSWGIPRLEGPAKAALVEIQADEYGGGDPEWMHARLFAQAMEAVGLDAAYGAYLNGVPGTTLATVNLVSMFGLHRRWRGALAGHLALFELSSPLPNACYAAGLRRLGFGYDATRFFDEHVEADSVHEVIAVHDLAAGLVRQEPELAADVMFGARALDLLERRFARTLSRAWTKGGTSLRLTSEPRDTSAA